MHTDGNFPAPLQALGFLGAATLTGLLALVLVYGLIAGKPWVKRLAFVLAAEVALYLGLVFVFSVLSREQTLARGEEKYFCEIDCHLAYSVVNVAELGKDTSQRELAVTIQTRFDEHTISPRRPKEAPLTPNPREVVLLDAAGSTYAPRTLSGTPMETELIPGQSYQTTLVFDMPKEASGLRLLIAAPAGPTPILIGNEMSWGHSKTYLGL